jgi:hypothetical protein
MLSPHELDALETQCGLVPITVSEYVATDYITTLLDTVLDYQNQTATVERAARHFEETRWNEVRTLEDLEALMSRYPDDQDGNRELAQHLWGNNHWRRAGELRGLAHYFSGHRVDSLEALRNWASTSTFADFEGKVKGLGPTVYQWLVMRLGVETVKPDVHVLRFVANTIGRPVGERESIEALEEVARGLGLKANVLDWSIWEYQRRGQSQK